MAKKKTQAIIAQPGTPADGYTLDVKYDPENDDAFEAKAVFNDGTVKSLGSGGSGGGVAVLHASIEGPDNYLFFENSYNDIVEMYNAGKIVCVQYITQNGSIFVCDYLQQLYMDDSGCHVAFLNLTASSSSADDVLVVTDL